MSGNRRVIVPAHVKGEGGVWSGSHRAIVTAQVHVWWSCVQEETQEVKGARPLFWGTWKCSVAGEMVPQLSPRMRTRVWFAACDVARQHKVTVTSRDLIRVAGVR